MKVNLSLILFGLFILNVFGVEGLENEVRKSKFPTLISKSINNGVSNGSVPDGPFCESITAYYVGTLQNKKSKQSFDVEFQLRLWVDKTTKKIHVKVDDWNEEYSKSGEFELDFYYEGNRVWCDIDDEECVSPLAKKETSFKLDLNTASGNYFHLLNFNYFNNSFGLVQPKDKCTKHQLDDLNDNDGNTPDLNELGFCVCCGDYAPNKLLACPYDEWSPKQPTQKPLPLTQKPLLPTKKPATPDNEKDPDYYNSTFVSCASIYNTSCSIRFVDKTEPEFFIYIAYFTDSSKATWYTDYYFLDFKNFNNVFVLTNAIGQCTKNQVQYISSGTPNTTLYEYCVCCGSEYNPDSQLGCPKNPWA